MRHPRQADPAGGRVAVFKPAVSGLDEYAESGDEPWEDWVSLGAVGFAHACGRRADDSLWCWGRGTLGQRGDGQTDVTRTTPVEVLQSGEDAGGATVAREEAYRANNIGVALLEQFKHKEAADAFRRAWDVNERLWEATVERAGRLPPERLHESVADEWSFVETLRHLAFASESWVGRGVLGDPRHGRHLGHDGLAAHLGQLVERPQYRADLVVQAE